MDLSLSEEQQLLRDSVSRYIQDNYSVELRRRERTSELGFSAERWREFAELGWLGLPFSEEDGGFGGSVTDLMVVLEQLGRGLVGEPYLVNIVLCGGFLSRAGDEQRARWIPPLIEGAAHWAFAFAEEKSRYRLEHVGLTARADGDGWILDGRKVAVLNGHCADHLIVSARTAGGIRDTAGISLFVVDAGSAGLQRRNIPLVDGSRGADIRLESVRVPAQALLGTEGEGLAMIEAVMADTLIGMGAEGIGAMDALLEQTVSYTRTRVQFGQAIGRFQALQHRMADMYLHCQAMRSLLYYAVIASAERREDSAKAAAAVKVKLGEAGRFVSQQAMQLHGGIGVTDELAVSHYFKRLLLLNTLFGDAEHHLDRFVRM